jgi:uncharacterized protein YdaU (DUF1376 family)
MNPSSYMPLYGNDFFSAMEGRSDKVVVSYIRLLWYYWNHNHCKGMEDDDDTLRRIARRDKDEWPAIRSILFDNNKYFCQNEDGLWTQKRADEEWAISKSKYEAAVNGGKARWNGVSKGERSRLARATANKRYGNKPPTRD